MAKQIYQVLYPSYSERENEYFNQKELWAYLTSLMLNNGDKMKLKRILSLLSKHILVHSQTTLIYYLPLKQSSVSPITSLLSYFFSIPFRDFDVDSGKPSDAHLFLTLLKRVAFPANLLSRKVKK